jgi:hypothetical protein
MQLYVDTSLIKAPVKKWIATFESILCRCLKRPGFVTYYWLNSGAGAGASLSVFESKEGAEESVRAAANFVQQHLSGVTVSKPEIFEGEVQAYA